ncbi:hypothetical protein B0H14DRAFT_2778004, partial [Mycena olivaceomarginata]
MNSEVCFMMAMGGLTLLSFLWSMIVTTLGVIFGVESYSSITGPLIYVFVLDEFLHLAFLVLMASSIYINAKAVWRRKTKDIRTFAVLLATHLLFSLGLGMFFLAFLLKVALKKSVKAAAITLLTIMWGLEIGALITNLRLNSIIRRGARKAFKKRGGDPRDDYMLEFSTPYPGS